MTKYLNTKPGSVEEVVANMSKSLRQDGAYQDMFKKELDKAGKGIGSMSPKEKRDFFNKIDSKYKAKNESVNEGGPGSGPQGGETRGTYKTGHKKTVMKPGAGPRPGSAKDGGQTDDEADQYDTEIGEADLTKSQTKKVHKMADNYLRKTLSKDMVKMVTQLDMQQQLTWSKRKWVSAKINLN